MPIFRYENPRVDRLIFGEDAATVLAEQAGRLQAGRIMILTSASLRNGPLVRSVEMALGKLHVATDGAITAGAPRRNILSAAATARDLRADLLLAIGGGSVIDAAKLVQLCVREDLRTVDTLSRYDAPRLSQVSPGAAALRTIAVPTTLSGAEFATLAGSFNPDNGRKEPYDHPLFIPKVIVCDPAALAQTPVELIVTTGIRMMDHCVERFCSTDAQPYSDAQAIGALTLLMGNLPNVKHGRGRQEDYGQLQLASWMSMDAVNAGVAVGVSHAIGRVLGAVSGIAHGHTSAILLPAVLAWNPLDRSADARQQQLAQTIAKTGSMSQIVGNFIATLGQPRHLAAVGVQRAMLPKIAADAMVMLKHPSVGGNARPVTSEQDVLDILELAW